MSAQTLEPEALTPAPPAAELPCTHCGLPTAVVATKATTPVFCCTGCRGAYQLIHGWGLDNYYALRDQRRVVNPAPVGEGTLRYAAFEEDAFLGPSKPRALSDGMMSAEFALHGLHCAACAWLIENAALQTPGWQLARVKMSDHTIRLVFDPSQIRLSKIAKLLSRLGYELLPLTGEREDHFREENRRLLIQIAVAGFFAANAMWIAVGLYAGEALGVEAGHRSFLRLIGSGLGVAAVVVPGRTFFRGALAALRTRTPHMDLPVALGLAVGAAAGGINALTGRGDVYFDSLATLVFLLMIGRWIQFRQQHRAAAAIDLLLRITPLHARRVDGGGRTRWVLVDSLQIDDTIRVDAGESIPVDGRISRGQTTLDRSLLTGESLPVGANVGDEVAAGTVNLTQAIDVRVEAKGRESRIGKIMQTVEAAMGEKAPVVQLADRIGGVFVVVITALAVLTLFGWARVDWGAAAAHATSLLIVACPCALAMATPLAIAVSLGRAANRKLLIRDGGSLQLLARRGTLWFDKTGTLTQGQARAEIVYGSMQAVHAAAVIEQSCCHPVSEAIRRLAAEDRKTRPSTELDASDGPTHVGVGGVCGETEGRRVHVGNLTYMRESGIDVDGAVRRAADDCLAAAASPVLIAIDGVAVAVLRVADQLKPEAKEVVSELRRRGWTVGILSGDHASVVRHVASQVGIEPSLAFGGLSPEEKLARVRKRGRGTVVMVGDGANDAAALAAADVGIAVRGGAEVSLQAAPIFVASPELSAVTELMSGATNTSRLIITAFCISLGYNLIAVALAMAGMITPLLAAVLMPISSMTVLTLTLLWPTFREPNV